MVRNCSTRPAYRPTHDDTEVEDQQEAPRAVQGARGRERHRRYEVLAKQMQIARPNELGALYMMRTKDRTQQEAMMLVQQAKTAVWTRWLILVAVAAIPLNGLVTLLVTRCA